MTRTPERACPSNLSERAAEAAVDFIARHHTTRTHQNCNDNHGSCLDTLGTGQVLFGC